MTNIKTQTGTSQLQALPAPIPLRAHHGMCLHFFQGRGYSTGFIANMLYYQRLLREENPQVRLLSSADAICEKCPHRQGERCRADDKVIRYDRAVLNACDLAVGAILRYADFTARVRANILDCGRRSAICGGCQWDALCLTPQSAPASAAAPPPA